MLYSKFCFNRKKYCSSCLKAWFDRQSSTIYCQRTPQTNYLVAGAVPERRSPAVEHWNRLPRAVAESPSLETFKAQLNLVIGSLLQLTKLSGLDYSSLQISATLWFSDLCSLPLFPLHSYTKDYYINTTIVYICGCGLSVWGRTCCLGEETKRCSVTRT